MTIFCEFCETAKHTSAYHFVKMKMENEQLRAKADSLEKLVAEYLDDIYDYKYREYVALEAMWDSCLLQKRQGRQRDSYKILKDALDMLREKKRPNASESGEKK